MKRELPSNHPSVSDTAQPCPYLEGFPGETNAVIRSLGPANQGKVPNTLFYAVLLSVVASAALKVPKGTNVSAKGTNVSASPAKAAAVTKNKNFVPVHAQQQQPTTATASSSNPGSRVLDFRFLALDP